MDLSVLSGPDPAGYKAEELSKKRKSGQQERNERFNRKQQTPGSIAAADSGQFHVYRKNRRKELDRLQAFKEELEHEKADEEFLARSKEKQEQLESKTAKRRAKRKQKQLKKLASSPAQTVDCQPK